MKKLLIYLLLSVLLIIGIKKTFFDGKNEIIEESSEIIVDYVDTLTGTIQDTKELKKSVELIQDKLQNELNSIK